MVHESVGSFAETRLHPSVLRSLQAAGIQRPSAVQRNLFSCAGDAPDAIVETCPKMGRSTAIAAYAAHCAIVNQAIALVVCDNIAMSLKLKLTLEALRFDGVTVENRFTDGAAADREESAVPSVVVCTLNDVLHNLPERFFARVAVFMVQDAAQHDSKLLTKVISRVTNFAPEQGSVVLCTSRPPSEIEISVRYLLRRSRRRYFSLQPGGATYTTLLCHDDDDRSELCLRAAEITGLRRVLVLTHNKEVRELKAFLQSEMGLRTFCIQRATSPADREKALSDFLESRFAVLVAVDAYTGVDLMDVDAVIQFYPPQKSMSEEDWNVYAACLNTTCNPASPTLVVSIVASDDLSLISYFFKKIGLVDLPVVLNISPSHVQFADLVRRPEVAVDVKLYGEAPLMGSKPAATSVIQSGEDDEDDGGAAAAPAHHQGGQAQRKEPFQQQGGAQKKPPLTNQPPSTRGGRGGGGRQ